MSHARILIAEDSSTQALRLQYVLATHGYEVVVATDGGAALAQVDAVRPAIVISDILMPVMDGYELCRRIKADERRPGISVILLTSLTDAEVVIKALQCGADKFITKPYDEAVLLAAVDSLIHNRGLADEEKETMTVAYRGQTYEIASSPRQILTLLLSTYETAMAKNDELLAAQNELRALNRDLESRVHQRTEALTLEVAERRQAQEALRENERYIRSILDTTPAIVAVFDLQTRRVTSVNRSVERLLGYSPQTIYELGEKVPFVLSVGCDGGGAAAVARLRQASPGEHVEWEAPVSSARGETLMLRYRAAAFDTGADGELASILVAATDVTAEHDAQVALAQSAAHLQAIMDAQLEPHIVYAAIRGEGGQIVDFEVTDANPAAAAFAGAPRAALIGTRMAERFPPFTATAAMQGFIDVVERGEPLVLDDVPSVLDQPGAPARRLDIRAVRLGDGVSESLRDVTARHEAEDALRRRLAELDALQRMSALLAGPIELETALPSACRQLAQLFEARAAEVHLLAGADGQRAFSLLGAHGGAVGSDVVAAMTAAVAGGRCSATRDDAGRQLLAVPLVAQAETIGALAITRDATEFSERERAVAATAADLLAAVICAERLHDMETQQATARERQRLARDLHDAVVQIIYSASLMVEALPSTWEQEPQQGRSDLLIVRRLIRAALAEMRILLFELRPEALAVDSVQTLLERLADALAWHNELAVDLDVDHDLALPEDIRTVFYRVAQEALSNTAKHSGASRVTVKVALAGEGVRLTVRDDGAGFDAAHESGATGFSVMRERAASIGAALAIAGVPGEGTTVTLDWPLPLPGADDE